MWTLLASWGGAGAEANAGRACEEIEARRRLCAQIDTDLASRLRRDTAEPKAKPRRRRTTAA